MLTQASAVAAAARAALARPLASLGAAAQLHARQLQKPSSARGSRAGLPKRCPTLRSGRQVRLGVLPAWVHTPDAASDAAANLAPCRKAYVTLPSPISDPRALPQTPMLQCAARLCATAAAPRRLPQLTRRRCRRRQRTAQSQVGSGSRA